MEIVKTKIKAAVLIGVFSTSVFPTLSHAASCTDVSSGITRSFGDFEGKISDEDRMQLNLLSTCAKDYPYCVAVERPSPQRYGIIAGRSLKELDLKGKNQVSASGIALVRTTKHRDVCVLVRYSGGSAATWMLEAWAIEARGTKRLNTDHVVISGEAVPPSVIMKTAVEKIARIK